MTQQAAQFWTNNLGSEMWVFDVGSLPPWRDLQTGGYSNTKPSEVDRKFTPSGPYTSEDANLFPYAGQYISGFPSATGARAPSPAPTGEVLGPPVSQATFPTTPSTSGVGEVPPLNPDDFYWKWDDASGAMVPARKNESGATFSNLWWAQANESRRDVETGGAPGGRAGPTAAELAIQRSQVQAQNLATFISGTIAELETEIDAKRLSTEQALGEFNRRLDAFSEAGEQFIGIQPFTIPRGAEFIPGFEPEGIATRLGLESQVATPIDFDPFGMAAEIVAETPVLTDIGVPSGSALDEAIAIARGFVGG